MGEIAARRPARNTVDANPVAGAVVLAIVVLAGVGIVRVWWSTRPKRVEAGPETMELRDESPALVDLLTGGLQVDDDAVPATAVDLATRGYYDIEDTGGGTVVLRLRTAGRPDPSGLTAYGGRVLRQVERNASGGLRPAAVLTIGPHGGSASGGSWAPLVARLDGFHCLLLDRPGCGLSDPVDVDLSDLDRFGGVADVLLVDVLDGLDLPTAHVVATSLGGHFALRGAATHPDRIDRMVEFGYLPGAPLARLPLSMRIGTVPGARRLMTSTPPTRGAVNAILRQLGMGEALKDGRISPEMVDWFHALLRDTPTMRNDIYMPRELVQKAGKGAETLPATLLANVRCPVLFVWGDDDPLGGADVARSFVPLIPGADLELWADTGHAPWMEHPERAAATVADFFSVRQS